MKQEKTSNSMKQEGKKQVNKQEEGRKEENMKKISIIQEAGRGSTIEVIMKEANKKQEAPSTWKKPILAEVGEYWEGYGSREEMLPRIEKAGMTAYNPLIDFIKQEGSRRIAKHICKKIAGDTKNRYSGEACRKLVNNGFTEEIFQDVVISIEEALFLGYEAGELWFDYNRTCEGIELIIRYGEYINKNGENKPFYNKLYNAFEEALYKYNGRQAPSKEAGIIQNFDGLYYNEEAGKLYPTYKQEVEEEEEEEGKKKQEAGKKKQEVRKQEVSYKWEARKKASPLYIASLKEEGAEDCINSALMRYDFVRLMQYIQKKASSKKYSQYCKVINGLFMGLKNEEIAKKHDLSIDIVKKARADLKTYYEAWKQEGREEINGYTYKNRLDVRRKASSVDFITTWQEDNSNSGKLISKEGYTEEGSKEAGRRKQEGCFHVVGYPNYDVMKQEAEEVKKKHGAYNAYMSIDYKQKKEEALLIKAITEGKKAGKAWKEAGRKAEEAYIIRQAWKEARSHQTRFLIWQESRNCCLLELPLQI